MAENSNILITVTTDSEGAVQNIDKLGTSVNKAGESTKNFRQQIKELTNELQTTTSLSLVNSKKEVIVKR